MNRRTLPWLGLCLLLLAVQAQAQDPADDPFRLGSVVRPLYEDIELSVDPSLNNYRGEVRIAIEVTADIDSFRIHAREMTLESIGLNQRDDRWRLSATEGESGLLTLHSDRIIPRGRYDLRITFSNDFDTRAHSLYRLEYEDIPYLFTQFEATDARGAFPCFDEPEFKIPWQLVLTAPASDMVLSNTPIETTAELDGGMVRTTFETTPPLPSYLLAIAVGPFDTVEVPGMKIPTRVVCAQGRGHLAQTTVELTPPIVDALERYFGRAYPYKKLDLIAVPEFWAGAMENPGAITFRDTILLLDPESVTASQRRRLASVNAHELAHQWFGNLVTMQWWDDLWLNESFATWLGNKITDQVFPEFHLAATSVESAEMAKSIDARESTRAIRAPVYGNENMESMDAGITYSKGAAVLGMFESFLGEETFQEGVRGYISANAEGNATASDLFEALGRASGMDVASAMSTFTDQPGIPNVRVNQLGDGRLEFVQTRFSNFDKELAAERNWIIPIVFRWSDGHQTHTQRLLLSDRSQIVDLPGGANPRWIHPNDEERGYYRWELDPDQLRSLVEDSAQNLSLRERVALVGVLTSQLDAGRLDGGSYLELSRVLCEDSAPEVIDAALVSLSEVRVAFVTDEDLPAFQEYVRSTLRPILKRYGLSARDGEDEAINLLRPSLIQWLGLYADDAEVQAFAREVTDRYLEDHSSVDPSIAGTCLQVAALHGGWRLYNAFRKGFESATIPAERSRFLAAMGHFDDHAMQEAALHYTLQGPTRPQEVFTIPMGVAQTNLENPDFMWHWFQQNFDAISEKIPEMYRAFLPYFAMGCDEARVADAREFFATKKDDIPGYERTLAKVAEQITHCAQMRERESSSVRNYLQDWQQGGR